MEPKQKPACFLRSSLFVPIFSSCSSIFKHYLVTRMHDGRFSIEVENPVSRRNIHRCLQGLRKRVLSQVLSHLLIEVENIGQLEDGFKVLQGTWSSLVGTILN